MMSPKAIILQHWFGIDRILFNESAGKVLSKDEYEQYLSTKCTLLANLYELYMKMGTKKNNKKLSKLSEVVRMATEASKISSSNAKKIMEKASVTKIIKEEIKETTSAEGLSENQVAKYVVTKRHNAISIDAMLFEHVKSRKLDWAGKVFVDAHKLLRDSLIDISLQ